MDPSSFKGKYGMRRFHYFLATGCYSGYSPIAPGTAGSAFAWLIFWLIPGFRGISLLAACVLFFAVGVYSATQVEKYEKKKDSGKIVIDEVVGMWLTLLFLPAGMNIIWWIAGFFVFRIFDIIKPFPANRSQALKGGWGVMADDVIAGIYANLLLRILFHFIG